MNASEEASRTVSPEALAKLEEDLNRPRFLGFPAGSTLGDEFIISLSNARQRLDVSSLPRSFGSLLRSWFGRRDRGVHSPPPPRETILVAWAGKAPRLRDLMLPVATALGRDNCTLLVRDLSVLGSLDEPATAVTWHALPPADLAKWRCEFLACIRDWTATLRNFTRQHRLSDSVIVYFLAAIAVQTQRLMRCDAFLRQHRPSAILTDSDRNAHSSCLVLAARALGIPSITLVHGVVGPYGYTPLLADIVCCWGAIQMQRFRDLGVESSRIKVAGCPRLSRHISADRLAVRARLNIPADALVTVLATSPQAPSRARRTAEIYCRALDGIPSVVGLVRLHPSEKVQEYSEVQGKHPRVRFLPSALWTADEALAAVDAVIVEHSGFGNDAVLNGKCTIVLSPDGSNNSNGRELVEDAGCLSAASAPELMQRIAQVLQQPGVGQDLLQRAEAYAPRFCAYYGEDAARRIADEALLAVGNAMAPARPRGAA
jgi:hypothetical protein